MSLLLTIGDATKIPLADESVQCVITSPPYWGLRSYLPDDDPNKPKELGLEPLSDCMGWATGNPCGECYVCHMVQVFREVRRVLKPDGTLWLNIGDSYAGSGQGWQKGGSSIPRGWLKEWGRRKPPGYISSKQPNGLKPKDLVGIPWRVALALQADGWWLRQDIIWHKPSPMPESVQDRCTKAHEYIFLLAKSKRYYWDASAIAEPAKDPGSIRKFRNGDGSTLRRDNGRLYTPRMTRNKRSVWTVTAKPYGKAHFATFPPALVEPMVLAGSRVGDVVLDPFAGTATVGEVSVKHNRKFVGIELNRRYIALAKERLSLVQTSLTSLTT